jgi:hypothetical protein
MGAKSIMFQVEELLLTSIPRYFRLAKLKVTILFFGVLLSWHCSCRQPVIAPKMYEYIPYKHIGLTYGERVGKFLDSVI